MPSREASESISAAYLASFNTFIKIRRTGAAQGQPAQDALWVMKPCKFIRGYAVAQPAFCIAL